jgi:hypothetical protein
MMLREKKKLQKLQMVWNVSIWRFSSNRLYSMAREGRRERLGGAECGNGPSQVWISGSRDAGHLTARRRVFLRRLLEHDDTQTLSLPLFRLIEMGWMGGRANG